MNINWGKGLIGVFVVFFLGMGFMVYKSVTKNVDLVTPNYYEKEIKYQEQINKINNTNSLATNLKIEAVDDAIILTYPSEYGKISGEISFYRPSDAKSDFKVIVEPGTDARQVISTVNLTKGLWKVQVNWKIVDKDYFSEEKIMVQ